MPDWLAYILLASLLIHLLLIGYCVLRVWFGHSATDRLIGADLVGILSLAVLILVAALLSRSAYIDVAVGLAAVGFVVTLLLAKFIGDGHSEDDPHAPRDPTRRQP